MFLFKFAKLYSIWQYCRLKKRLLEPEWQSKNKTVKVKNLSKGQKKLCRKLWKHSSRCNKWVAFYNSFYEIFDERMLPDNIYYSFIDPYFNNIKLAKAIDDKNNYDLLFNDVRRPKTVCRKIEGMIYGEEYETIDQNELRSLIGKYDKLIMKPSVDSEGGRGIFLWNSKEGFEGFKEKLNRYDNVVVQEILSQHETMDSLHSQSLNTIRIITLAYKQRIHPLSTIVRMGVGNSFVDNASSGGIFCGVESNGRLKSVAHNTHGETFLIHPQGAKFEQHIIPNYDECIKLVKKLAPRLSRTSKLLSWDLAIGKDGHPVLIEVNMCYGELDFHQISNGPLLGDLTYEIIESVFKKKEYKLLSRFY